MDVNYKICAVIVTYNRLSLLKVAIESLLSQSVKLDILVVNNGSTDGTEDYLKTLNGIKVINQNNSGGAGGFFTGIKHSVEQGYDFSWVMDDDVIAAPNALESLLEGYNYLLEKGEKIGFLCSTVTNSDGYTVNNPVVDDVRLNPTYHPSWNKYLVDGLIGVKTATFVSVLIPCNVSKELGLPIKEFFIWGDDTEYTIRISQRYNCYLVGKSVVKHLRVGDKPIGLVGMTDKRRVRMYENSIRNNIYLLKHGYYDKKYVMISIIWHFITLGKLLIKFSPLKLKVLIKGTFSGIFFNPKIQFPD